MLRGHLALFPPACHGCGRLLEPPASVPKAPGANAPAGYPFLCSPCHRSLPWTDGEESAAIAGLDRLWAPFGYAEPVDGWIQQLKYGRRDGLSRMLAGLVIDAPAGPPPLPPGALVVPVPLHPRRLWMRGFNQSLLLAHAWLRHASDAGDRAEPPTLAPRVLVRQRYTRPQVRMSKAERHTNVAGAFALHSRLKEAEPLKGCHVLLVDDVTTTGATLGACAQVLRAAGAGSVEGLVLARA